LRSIEPTIKEAEGDLEGLDGSSCIKEVSRGIELAIVVHAEIHFA